jgi:two-component system chemotaxis response regulator CheY
MEQKRRLKLMIVDDHAETRVLIRELVSRFADEIRECANGKEAATECVDFRPDLVTMDLNMPLTGGLEATRRILSHNPEARVIVITQFDSPEFRLAANRAGACHFFSKNNLIGLLRYLEQHEQISSSCSESPFQ